MLIFIVINLYNNLLNIITLRNHSFSLKNRNFSLKQKNKK
jgi:hypothetical protein